MSRADDREALGLPKRPFLYTLDQVASLLSITEGTLRQDGYLFFMGRQPGMPRADELRVVNIAPADKKPRWRAEETELIRWMKRRGFRYVDR